MQADLASAGSGLFRDGLARLFLIKTTLRLSPPSPTSFCFILVYYSPLHQSTVPSYHTDKMSVTTAAPVEAKTEPQKLSGLNLYSRFAFAGAVCCSVTHGGLTPVDV